MPRVVTSACDGCKFTDCVTVCPVDCFHEGPTMLYIDPNVCIDCDACVPQCPVAAIYEASAVPEAEKKYIQINAEESQKTPTITAKKDPLPGAEERKKALEAAAAGGGGGGGGGVAGGAAGAPKGPSPEEIAAKRQKEAEERKRREEEKKRIAALKKERLARFLSSLAVEKERLPDDDLERDRRYGDVFWLEERPGGYRLRVEFPRRIPRSRTSEEMGLSGPMPDYRYTVERPAPDRIVVRAWVEDPRVRELVGRVGSFPFGFTREVLLPRSVVSHETRYRDHVLEVDLAAADAAPASGAA